MGILKGKVVVVSGIGPGLGQALARQAARHGAKVVLAARTAERLTELGDELRAGGAESHEVPTDITDEDSVQRLVSAATERFGRVDSVINNAFLMAPMSGLTDVDVDKVKATFEVNLYGSLRVTRAFTPALAEADGSVVFINSAVVKHSMLPYGPYKLAKSALLAAAQSLATELGPLGIRVNTVAPGYIWAGALQAGFKIMADMRGDGSTMQDLYDETAKDMDLRRLPEPDEIADAALFFSSDLSRAVTGQCLEVSCGWFHH